MYYRPFCRFCVVRKHPATSVGRPQGLHSVVLRNRQTNTLRVTEAIVSLLEIMLSMDVMLLERDEERQEGSGASGAAGAAEEQTEPERPKAGFLVHYLYMDILVR